MSGVPKIEIKESANTLRALMNSQKQVLNYAKLQALYILKIGQVETVRPRAAVMGKGEATIHRWLRMYREGGINELLAERPKTGRPRKDSTAESVL